MPPSNSQPRLHQASTIAEVIRARRPLGLRCMDCDHMASVDLSFVAARLGDDSAVMDVVRRGRCTRCGSRHVSSFFG